MYPLRPVWLWVSECVKRGEANMRRSSRGFLNLIAISGLGMLAMIAIAAPALMLNGQLLEGSDRLVIIGDKMLLPTDVIFDAIGAVSEYDANGRKLTVTRGENLLKMWTGSKMATLDDQPMTVDASPVMVGEVLYVPVRTVIEAFGGNVQFDAANNTTYLTIEAVGTGPTEPEISSTDPLRLQGTVVQLYTGTATSLLMKEKASVASRIIPLAAQCSVSSLTTADQYADAALTDIVPGAEIEVTVEDGQATQIILTSSLSVSSSNSSALQHFRGELVGVTGEYLLLADGRSILIDQNAMIFDENSTVISASNLQPQNRVLIVLNTTLNSAVKIVREATGLATEDHIAPNFVSLAPMENATLQESSPVVRVDYKDDASAINRAAVIVQFDEEDVTSQATIRDTYLQYRPQYISDGPHSVDVSITDRVGNVARKQWSFTVEAPATSQILMVSHNAHQSLSAGEVLEVTAKVARPGHEMKWDIGTWKTRLPMQRVGQSNTYIGTYTVEPGDNVTTKLIVYYRQSDQNWILAESLDDAVIDAATAIALAITEPADGTALDGDVTIRGTGPAGGTVRLQMTFNKKILLDLTHEMPEQVVTISEQGIWETEPVRLKDGLYGMADTYSIRASLIDAEGNVLNVVEITIKSK